MVVQGRWEFVGNDPEKALAALGRIRDDDLADVTLGPITRLDAHRIEVPVEARYPASKKQDGKLRLWLAITENDLASEVARGENRGRTLKHVGVVRELRALDDGRPDGSPIVARPTVRLAKDWQPSQLRVVAFLQRAPGGPILGAAVSDLPPNR